MELKQRERDFDLIIEVEDHSIPVHSSILSEYSAAIRKMMEALSNNPKENDKEPTNICLRGHSVKDVKDLLDFAYFPDREIDGKFGTWHSPYQTIYENQFQFKQLYRS